MSPWTMYAVSGAAIVAVALHGLFARENLFTKVMAANLVGGGVFLILVALARRAPGAPDPVPHALVLTGIVVSVSATALALFLLKGLGTGRDVPPSDERPSGGDGA